MGVFIPKIIKPPQCPYCFEGTIIIDKETKHMVCDTCDYIVVCRDD